MRFALLSMAVLVAAGCSGADEGPRFDPLPFPDGFLWGTATAAHQVDGGNDNNDWWAWEQIAGKIANGDVSGDAADHYARFDEDFALAAAMDNDAHRFSIEWSRVEPARDVRDDAEIAHYHAVLDSLEAHGMVPIVTLSHFTLPLWANDPLNPAADLDGWFNPEVQGEFAEFAGDMAEEFGDQIDLWVPFNEPMVSAVAASQAVFPPDLSADSVGESLGNATQWVVGMIFAHGSAYDAIRLRDVADADGDGIAAQVGIAQHMVAFAPTDPADPAHVEAAAWLDHVFNRLFLDAITSGNLDVNLDGDYDDVATVPPEGSFPQLAGRLDWVGVNYYRRMLAIPLDLPPLQAYFQDDPDLPSNDLGWTIYPEGMLDVLREVDDYGLPIIVTENGIPDGDDDERPAYLVDHLVSVQRAIDEGIPVEGYMHWSLVDNFEWAEGFEPRFGLIAVDYATQTRTPRTAYDVFAEICRENALTSGVQKRHRTIE